FVLYPSSFSLHPFLSSFILFMITGTFLDEITHDIPYQNWGREEWTRDFQAMRAIGMDTDILIRAGYQDKATFDSRILRQLHPHLILQEDHVGIFPDL